jgi:hypothetical protein
VKHYRKFIPITKVDEEKRLVYGLATCEKKDRAGEICHYETTKPYYMEWSGDIEKASGGKSKGNVRAMHGKVAAGKLTEIVYDDDNKAFPICAKVVDDAEWKKVMEGVYTGFSQGGEYVKVWKDAESGDTYYTAKPAEVSLVDLPCLPESTFSVIKADGSQELRKFATVTVEPSHTDVGNRANDLAKAAGDERKWMDFAGEAREALINEQIENAAKDKMKEDDGSDNQDDDQNDGKKPAKDKNPDKGKKDAKKPAKVADKIFEVKGPFFKCNHADHEHINKADAVSCLRKDAADEAAAEIVTPLSEAIAKLRETIGEPELSVADRIAKFFADDPDLLTEVTALVKDKSDEDALEALHKRFGKALAQSIFVKDATHQTPLPANELAPSKEETTPTAEDFDRAVGVEKIKIYRSLIKSGVKKIGELAREPLAEELRKGLYDVCRLASLISELKWLVDGAFFERQMEGDASIVPEGLKAATIQLCECLKTMVEEETGELFEDGDDVEVLEMAAGSLSPTAVDALVKSDAKIGYVEMLTKSASVLGTLDAVLDLAKAEIEKKGARNNKGDAERIQKMHDLSNELGASCGDGGADKVASGDLSKLAVNEALSKQLTSMVEIVVGLVKDVEKIKAQPVQGKVVLRMIGKNQDTVTDLSEEAQQQIEKLNGLKGDALALELTKLSLANPIPISVKQ